MGVIDTIHSSYVHDRRVRVLAERIARLIPPEATVLDVGCGDGLLARLILDHRPDIQVRGLDVLVRPGTHIAVEPFDGTRIPSADGSQDVVLFVDVLHHTADPMVLLREARRVARRAVVIKDHARDGVLAGPTLRLMDYIGNARHGVALPYNYWPKARWLGAFEALGLRVAEWQSRLGLYPAPASWVFGRSLHFIARLERS